MPRPRRVEITVLPADDPKRLRIGWTVYEEVGFSVISDCAVHAFGDPLRPITAEEFLELQASGEASAQAVNGTDRWGWWYVRGEHGPVEWRGFDALGQHAVDF